MGFKRSNEASFEQTVEDMAALFGWHLYHTRDSRGSKAGFPDLVMTKKGRLVFAELKQVGKKPTAAQWVWLKLLGLVETATGGIVLVRWWTPEDWPEIERVLGIEQ
jgi:hypothetical protein